MLLLFTRFLVLFFSAGISIYLLYHSSILLLISALVFITMIWTALTMYAKRTLKWSLINYILTPVLLWTSALSILIFSTKGFQQYIIIAVTLLLSSIWMTTLQYTLTEQDKIIFRGNLLSYINSFIIFFSASSLYAALIFISWSLWSAIGIMTVLVFILHLHIMLASHLTWTHIKAHSFVTALLMGELFASLIMLPTTFWVKGLLVTIGFYIITGLSRCALTSVLSTILLKRYLLWGSFIVIAILITAPWQ